MVKSFFIYLSADLNDISLKNGRTRRNCPTYRLYSDTKSTSKQNNDFTAAQRLLFGHHIYLEEPMPDMRYGEVGNTIEEACSDHLATYVEKHKYLRNVPGDNFTPYGMPRANVHRAIEKGWVKPFIPTKEDLLYLMVARTSIIERLLARMGIKATVVIYQHKEHFEEWWSKHYDFPVSLYPDEMGGASEAAKKRQAAITEAERAIIVAKARITRVTNAALKANNNSKFPFSEEVIKEVALKVANAPSNLNRSGTCSSKWWEGLLARYFEHNGDNE